ncbi:Uncharacterized protein Adt_40015 [Abeliophyllum distichum]|uniref:Retrotransposon gag domain-containing protein n=1 Tax=Abeliophyllum distichum TaxID=126358 RepID=A0ABD1Q9X1_9LAMI
MSLRGAAPALKCRAFHLTLSGGAKRWYNKLVAGSISSLPELKKTFINYFSSGKPASTPVITDSKALFALKGGLDMNLSFWRDVRNKNPTTFDQLVEMITEEITNENMILHRNHGEVAPNQMPKVNYGRNQGKQLP